MNPLLAIIGPTACGKTSRAVTLAQSLGGEIISADSRQVYRGMDIGTGKDKEEYGDIPVHMLDLCCPGHKYNLFEYLRDAHAVYKEVKRRGRLPILCGGTGMYVEAFLNGLQLPEVPQNTLLRDQLRGKSLDELADMLQDMKTLHNVTDLDTPQRAIRAIEIQTYYKLHPEEAVTAQPSPLKNALIIGISIDRESRRQRIRDRLLQRLQDGLVEEVSGLLQSGVSPEDLVYYGLEYKYVTLHLIGKLSFAQMEGQLLIAIHQFAKRQMTWFRGMERRGHHIEWLDWQLGQEEFVARVKELMSAS